MPTGNPLDEMPPRSIPRSIMRGPLEFCAKPITVQRVDGPVERMLIDVYTVRFHEHTHVATFDITIDEWEAFTRA